LPATMRLATNGAFADQSRPRRRFVISAGRTGTSHMGTRRLATLTAVVVLLGGGLVWANLAPASWPGSLRSSGGYFFRFASAAGQSLPDRLGGATVFVGTNLPEGTLVVASFRTGDSGGGHGGQAVEDGAIRISVDNTHCANALLPESPTFTVMVATGPVIDEDLIAQLRLPLSECFRPEGCDQPQPKAVLTQLGEHFENLQGPQVRTVAGDRLMVAQSVPYTWPQGACLSANPQTGLADCPPQEPLFVVDLRRLDWIAARFEGLSNQWKPCVIWASGSEGFRATNPWPGFRDRFTDWLDSFSDSPAGLTTNRVVSKSEEVFAFKDVLLPERFTVEYLRNDLTIAIATFAHATGCYELDELELRAGTAAGTP
jgi:hypothetical protein